MAVKILPLGDSLTWGVTDNNVTANDQYGGYRTVLLDSLDAAGFKNPTDIDFIGEEDNTDPRISGPNSIDNDHEGRRGERINQLTDAASLGADIVLLMAGTNDFLQNASVEEAQNRLESLIEALANSGADHILVASIPPFAIDDINDVSSLDAQDEANRVSFNSLLPAFLQDPSRFTAATRAKITFVDVAGALDTTDISSDGVHITSLGYSKVATAWHNALVPILDPTITPAKIERGTPQRIEAEDFSNLGDFEIVDNKADGLPDNTTVINLANATGASTATTTFNLATGYYDVAIGYFDESDAVGKISVSIGDDTLNSITLDQNLGIADISPQNYVRKTIGTSVQLTNGEQISLTGTPVLGVNDELIHVDYLEFIPVPAPTPNPPAPNPPAPNPPAPNPPAPNPPAPNPPAPNPPTPTPTGKHEIGNAQNNIFEGTEFDDTFSGRGGRDVARGRGGNDVLFGNQGNDRLFGNGGNDYLNGGAGNDRLVGGSGDDVLVGGRGVDNMRGGPGNDSFVYNTRRDGGKNGDRIQDFVVGEDLLVIKGSNFDSDFAIDRPLRRKYFTIGSEARNRNHRFIYDDDSGLLSFDPDGNGSRKAFKLARLDKGLDLNRQSFFVI